MNKILGTPGVEVEGVKSATYGPKERDKFLADARTLGFGTYTDATRSVAKVNGQITGEFDVKVGGTMSWSA